MEKYRCIQRIENTGIIAVIRAESPGQAREIAAALYRGGIDILEITMTVPGALQVIRELKQALPGGEAIIGAGTVLDSETARAALLEGAQFVVSPHFNPAVIRLCNRYRKLCMPGAGSITEIIAAMEAGADLIKVFPGNLLGPGFVRAVRGPLPHALLIPTGGVSLENAGAWIQSGCIAVGVGGQLTLGVQGGGLELVTAAARQFVEVINKARDENKRM